MSEDQSLLDVIRHPGAGGIMMAITMSVLRLIYDRKETNWIRITLESIICSGLTLAAGTGLSALGYSQEWYLVCGGFIGFMGSQSIRALANRFVRKL